MRGSPPAFRQRHVPPGPDREPGAVPRWRTRELTTGVEVKGESRPAATAVSIPSGAKESRSITSRRPGIGRLSRRRTGQGGPKGQGTSARKLHGACGQSTASTVNPHLPENPGVPSRAVELARATTAWTHSLRSEHEPPMQSNVGTIDRTLRVLLGVALLALVFVGPKTPWGWVGVVPLVTGLIGTCPLYSLIGVRTCAARRP